MITLQRMVWDIRRILRSTNDDTKIKDLHLIEKINHYRSLAIEKAYSTNLLINTEWVQSLRDEPLTQVASGDLPDYSGPSDLKFGKFEVPSVLSNDRGRFGLVRVSGTSGWNKANLVDKDVLQLMIEIGDWRLLHYGYYMELGNALYFYNYFGSINADVILGDPREGYIYHTTYVPADAIEAEVQYMVYNYPVYYNNAGYNPGGAFTGVAGQTSYTGKGKVKRYPAKHKLGYTDPYPIDDGMAQEVIWMVLTKDYQIEMKISPDQLNDAAETLKMGNIQ